jgi:DNA-binding IclR family transcriptional regulator
MGASLGGPDGLDKIDRLGVVDKVAAILGALEEGPATLSGLMVATGLPRATAHRLAVALGRHGLVGRDDDGRFVPGVALIGLGRAAADALPLRTLARPALEVLRDRTGESVQLYVAEDGGRRCVLSLQSPHALRWIVAEGALLPLDRGSAGRVLLAAESPTESAPNRRDTESAPARTEAERTPAARQAPNRRDTAWTASVEEREPGVASVSAPVLGPDGRIVAAVSVSGPVERLSRDPGARFGAVTVAAGQAVTAALRHSS